MQDSLFLCAAALIRNKGKSVFSETDVLMGMSMDLRWMTYSDAKIVLNSMIAEKVFERNGDVIRAAFDPSGYDVPVAYRPSEELMASVKSSNKSSALKQNSQEKPMDAMQLLMKSASEAGMERKEFMAKCNNISRSMGIYIESAALMVLRDAGADISILKDSVYDCIMGK